MNSQEIAAHLSRAYNTCRGDRCPYASQCSGRSETCVMKEVAMTIRAKDAEIETLTAVAQGLRDLLNGVAQYMQSLEKINKRYNDLIVAFQKGYRPQKKATRGRRGPKRIRKVTMEELIKRDGDERYAYQEPPKDPPKDPLVVI